LRYHRSPGGRAWLGLVVVSLLGWFSYPALFALLVPIGLIYYLSIGARHRLIWHVALLCGFGLAVAAYLFWLSDWLEYWWIRAPVRIESDVLSHRTLRSLWEAEATLWGSAADRTLAVALFAVGAVGVVIWNFQRERASARLMGLGAAGLLGLSVFGVTSEPLGSVGAVRLLIPALLFAVVPAVYGLVWLLRNLMLWSGSPWRGSVVLAGLLLMVLVPFRQSLAALALRCTGTTPFFLGLGP